MPVTARIAASFLLALLGGVCVVYAPVPAFTAVGLLFAVGLWSLTKKTRSYRIPSRAVAAARKSGRSREATSTKLVSGFLLVWWLASIAPIVAYSPRDVTDAAQASVGGSLHYQVLLIAFGGVGALFLPRALRRFDRAFRWVAGLWVAHLGWMFASLAWSVYEPITFRNAVAFVLVSVGSFGLGAGFYGARQNGRDLFLRHVFWAGVISALALLLPLPFRWGEYALLDPAERLDIGGNFPAFVVVPAICAILVLIATAVLGVRRWQTRDWFWLALLVAPLLVLKSRGPVLFAVVALAVFYLLSRSRAQDRMLQLVLLVVSGIGALVYYSEGVYDLLLPYATRGSLETTMNLTGRLPLWDVIVSEISENPWLGVGFAAFWNPSNYDLIEQSVGFPAVSAHNGFLDIMLNTGAVGLAILVAFCLCALLTAGRRALSGDPMGWLAFLLLLFYVLQNLTSSVFTEFYELNLMVVLATLGLLAGRPAKGVAVAGTPRPGREREPRAPSRRDGASRGVYRAAQRRRGPL